MTERKHFLPVFFLALLACSAAAGAKDIFVATSGDDTNAGDAPGRALKTIAAASARAVPGDVIQILPGRYSESIRPTESGQPGRPITYRSYGPGPAILTHTNVRGLVHAIDITDVSHIVVDDVDVDGVARRPNARVDHFATISGGSHIVIRNGDFRFAHGWHGIGVQNGASYVTIENNSLDWVGQYDNGNATNSDVGDAILVGKLGGAARVLIQGNRLRHAGHNLIAVYGNNCVVQGNEMDNSFRDLLGGDAGTRVAEFVGSDNVFQGNYATGAGASSDFATNTIMKVEGANNIARFNILANGVADGLSSSARTDQPRATQLRIYHNTFYKLGGAAWRLELFTGGTSVNDNVFVNNLVVDSRLNPLSPNPGTDFVFKVAAANNGPTARSTVLGNLFTSTGKVLLQGFDGSIALLQAQSKYPQLFTGNGTALSQFVSTAPRTIADFDVLIGSPAVDRGRFLTAVTSGSGRGRSIKVADIRFFSDGKGLIPGDLIQLQGSRQRARVTRVDHAAQTLYLDAAIDFAAGKGVALAYERTAPDIGAREAGSSLLPATVTQLEAG